jgi:hypothetical protein
LKLVPDLAVGESWAYRASGQDPLVQVSIVRLGIKAPPRVLVRWVADDFEGAQDWVPPARLKAKWADVEEFRAREGRWGAVQAEAQEFSEETSSAVSIVFDLLIDEKLATLGYNAENGVLKVHDLASLAALVELDPKDLGRAPAFEEAGGLVAPMSVAVSVALRAVERDPYRILRYVEREEADAAREAIHGRFYPGRGPRGGTEISPAICRQVDEEHGEPVRAILREWCGAEPVDVRKEIAALRDEAERLQKLATTALDALRAAGHVRTANRIEREMGTPREMP